jgi:hypothetical protein
MSRRVVVLVFTHKPTLEWHEVIAYRQCFRMLGKHPIRLVCPQGMDTALYRELVPTVEIDSIAPRWLSSLRNYNRLKVKPFLYQRYSAYEFILTYELDAFVFRDDLEAWCDQSWDYIGAPWFEEYSEATLDAKPLGVGNSGFSLRRTEPMIRMSRSLRYQKPPGELFRAWRAGETRLASVLSSLTYRNNFYGPLNNYPGHEDRFWCEVAAPRFPEFKIAPYEAARRFSFEANPRRLFEECGSALPFGCHKWMNHDLEFWKPHLEQFGYSIPDVRQGSAASLTRPAVAAD